MESKQEIVFNFVDLFYDQWMCKIDHEDGSTAPFTSLALEYLYNV